MAIEEGVQCIGSRPGKVLATVTGDHLKFFRRDQE